MEKYIKLEISINNQKITIDGLFLDDIKNYKSVKLIAANPIDRMVNYTGSGLPFPNDNIAFENTVNLFIIKEKRFKTEFSYPNSFYRIDGFTKIEPSIFIHIVTLTNNNIYEKMSLPDLYPLKSLTYRHNRNTEPEYYDHKNRILPVDTAEEVMKAYAKLKLNERIE
jgi:hypothetical protein